MPIVVVINIFGNTSGLLIYPDTLPQVTVYLSLSHLQEDNVNLGVLHPPHQDGDQLGQVWLQRLLADWVLSQGKPELTCLQGHVFIRVLGKGGTTVLSHENCRHGWSNVRVL